MPGAQPLSPVPAVRGWCPTVRAPMETGDGWLVRARVGGRPVSAHQWRTVARIAAEAGNGLVEVTARANLQVRGLLPGPVGGAGEAAGRLMACGLAERDDARDRRRAVAVNPLAGLSPGSGSPFPASAGPVTVVRRIEDAVERWGRALPSKWWAVVDDGGPWPVPITGCDVALRWRAGRWHLIVAGRAVPSGSGTDPVERAIDVIDRCGRSGRRARDVLDPSGEPADRGDGAAPWWGVHPLGRSLALSVAPPLGVATARALDIVADLAGTPGIRLCPTPQRGIVALVPPARVGDAGRPFHEARRRLGALGWIVAADDGRRLVSACIGSRGCRSALVDTHDVAGGLEPAGRIHLSGCPKRCGAPIGVRHLVATEVGLEEHGR